MKQCKRLEIKDCPYRKEEIDFQHWVVKCGESFDYAKERAVMMCESIPCNYALELAIMKIDNPKRYVFDSYCQDTRDHPWDGDD